MPYTEATLLEILRMSVVVPLPIPRKAMEDYVYKGYLIPKASIITFLCTYLQSCFFTSSWINFYFIYFVQGSALFFNLSAVTMSKKYWVTYSIFIIN